MAKKNLTHHIQERLAGARRNLSLSAIDFSIPDESQSVEKRQTFNASKNKKGFLGFLGL